METGSQEPAKVVVRCPKCNLNQYLTRTGLCRRCQANCTDVEVVAPPVVAPVRVHTNRDTREALWLWALALVVKEHRHKRGLSQGRLAKYCAFPRTYISKLENQKVLPTLSSTIKIAAALSCNVSDLMKDVEAKIRCEFKEMHS